MKSILTKLSFLLGLLFLVVGTGYTQAPATAAATAVPDIIFVARAHLATKDRIFQDELGPAGQFGTGLPKFAPGSKLMIRHSNGTLTTLIDGGAPTPATGNLIDVQTPDVSFDGAKILFAGATTTDPDSSDYGWRLYEINVNGSGFRKLPIPDRSFATVPQAGLYDFGNQKTYGWWNDLFPAYMPDGRIVFASTRYPTRAHYDQRHTYNLYIVESDGTNLRRITTDRGGFLHPTPLPDGRILATRWWNNFNQPSYLDIYNRIDNRPAAYTLPDGTQVDANPDETFNPATGLLPNGYPIRDAPNTWHLMALNPDGTAMHRYAFTPYGSWVGALLDDDGKDNYTAAQPALVFSGGEQFIVFISQQDSTMVHSTHKTGIRIARPGVAMMYANNADAIAGLSYERAWDQDDEGPPYAIHPWGLPDGTILFSYAVSPNPSLPTTGSYTDPLTNESVTLQGSDLQYALYTMNLDGGNKTLLPTAIGTADAMDAKPIVPRSGWSTVPDQFTAASSDDPRQWDVPNTIPAYSFSQKGPDDIATATIHNPNIYANPPLDLPYINNSPQPGSVARAQVYIDANQFSGAFCYGDYPDPCDTFQQDNELRAILWTETQVSQNGEFTVEVPADVPGFVVLRDSVGRIVSDWHRGYISIAQGNAWARPGETVTCTGCHLGHVSGSIDAVQAEASQGWTNIAPYATVAASSSYVSDDGQQHFPPDRVNDRRGWVPIPAGGPSSTFENSGQFQDDRNGWISAEDQALGAQLDLEWPASMQVSKVRLVGPEPTGGDWGGFGNPSAAGPYHITAGAVRLYNDGLQVSDPLSVGQIEPLSNGGTWVNLSTPQEIDRLTFTVESVSGQWYHQNVAALNEIEVIGRATEIVTVTFTSVYLPAIQK